MASTRADAAPAVASGSTRRAGGCSERRVRLPAEGSHVSDLHGIPAIGVWLADARCGGVALAQDHQIRAERRSSTRRDTQRIRLVPPARHEPEYSTFNRCNSNSSSSRSSDCSTGSTGCRSSSIQSTAFHDIAERKDHRTHGRSTSRSRHRPGQQYAFSARRADNAAPLRSPVCCWHHVASRPSSITVETR